jgi:hypothetical protein
MLTLLDDDIGVGWARVYCFTSKLHVVENKHLYIYIEFIYVQCTYTRRRGNFHLSVYWVETSRKEINIQISVIRSTKRKTFCGGENLWKTTSLFARRLAERNYRGREIRIETFLEILLKGQSHQTFADVFRDSSKLRVMTTFIKYFWQAFEFA